jgi:sulfhydrogenase subunit gamma (sulfur reductase)
MAATVFPFAHDTSAIYRPQLVRVLDVREEIVPDAQTKRVVTISLERGALDYAPGQFLQIGVFPGGEVPISISSAHGMPGALMLTIRNSGALSEQLTEVHAGGVVGIRGPCGTGFDIDAHRGRDILFVAGGIGLAPLRGLLWQMLLERADFGRIIVLHGARTPRELLYPWQYADWQRQRVELLLSADRGDGRWENETDPPRCVGIITKLFERLALDAPRTSAFLCGPPIMIELGCKQLTERLGLARDRCVTTLERHMKCGIGKCGHCVIVDRYVCVDGPVFRYDELLALERIEPPW